MKHPLRSLCLLGLCVAFAVALMAANVTVVTGFNPCVIDVTATQGTLSLNKNLSYSIAPNGKTAAGADATSIVIYLSTDGSDVDTDESEGDGKVCLYYGRSVKLTGISTLKYKSASSATMQIIPGR